MQLQEVIEVNDKTPPFNEDEWIGRNRKYPKGDHTPLPLKDYIEGLLVIPDTVKDEHIPSGGNLSIAKAEISFRRS